MFAILDRRRQRRRLAFFASELASRRQQREKKRLAAEVQALWRKAMDAYINEPDYGNARRMLGEMMSIEIKAKIAGVSLYA